MTWAEARKQFPDTWLLFEALNGQTENGKWQVENLTVIKAFTKSSEMMREYAELRRQYPAREFGFFHTSKDKLSIEQQWWAGIRPA